MAAALARQAANAGKRVALIAASAPTDRLGRLFGRAPLGPTVTTVAPGIDAVNMTSESALQEYGILTLRSELVARALFENRATRAFRGAVPGLDAYALLGKAWWHTTERASGRPRYDLTASSTGPTRRPLLALMLRIPRRDPGGDARRGRSPRCARHRRAAARPDARGAADRYAGR